MHLKMKSKARHIGKDMHFVENVRASSSFMPGKDQIAARKLKKQKQQNVTHHVYPEASSFDESGHFWLARRSCAI